MTIRHSQGEYPVDFGTLTEAWAQVPHGAIVITDANVARHYPVPGAIVVPPGESSKSLEVYGDLLSQLAKREANRKTTLVAFGGGVIGDLVGFVAATYLRKVPFIQIPTTLLAQVDSSVGGKVAIDLPEGKNLVGAFYPPVAVHVALETLLTLPQEDYLSGCAEVLKYGLIMDAPFWSWLEEPVGPQDPKVRRMVERCIELKAEVVAEDEFETTGRRAILNFGHTVAHAVEQAHGYKGMPHGHAVAIGMVAEAKIGEKLGITEPGLAQEIEDRLTRWGLPTDDACLRDLDSRLVAMRRDKKATEGRLAFSLLTQIGTCKLVEGVEEGVVRAVLA